MISNKSKQKEDNKKNPAFSTSPARGLDKDKDKEKTDKREIGPDKIKKTVEKQTPTSKNKNLKKFLPKKVPSITSSSDSYC